MLSGLPLYNSISLFILFGCEKLPRFIVMPVQPFVTCFVKAKQKTAGREWFPTASDCSAVIF
jgi:hypothetical protein